ncbi:hypothetical protein [Knoellia koreensis]|uniref:Uncharacterized protein n=1 Tax=Knoellia koreensis TaxID=2730921 RepID=A0A849H5S6_9MICO|nr:hypothetical protein [Knoellia sp. DB2414S]NNM45136.1 hypothetical protein [Knoellia sp. DB2414S]
MSAHIDPAWWASAPEPEPSRRSSSTDWRSRRGRPVPGLARIVRDLGGRCPLCEHFICTPDCVRRAAPLPLEQTVTGTRMPDRPQRRNTVNDGLTPTSGNANPLPHSQTRAQERGDRRNRMTRTEVAVPDDGGREQVKWDVADVLGV